MILDFKNKLIEKQNKSFNKIKKYFYRFIKYALQNFNFGVFYIAYLFIIGNHQNR